jgi:hypothetical protein
MCLVLPNVILSNGVERNHVNVVVDLFSMTP